MVDFPNVNLYNSANIIDQRCISHIGKEPSIMFFISAVQSKSRMMTASANSAEASYSCANSANANFMILIVDAIFMASILVIGIISLMSLSLVLGLLVSLLICVSLILTAASLIAQEVHKPKRRALF